MAKNRLLRTGSLARWYRRLRWFRRVVMLGGLAVGIAKALGGRSGGSPAGGPGGAGGGPGGSGRRAPIGGPLSPSAAARKSPGPSADETASTGTARTLVAVPPLDAEAPDDVPADSGPVLTVVSDTDDAAGADRAWVEPLDGGECPPGHPIKANEKSGIYHVPEGRSYKRTAAQRCYSSAAAAEADGYRPAKA